MKNVFENIGRVVLFLLVFISWMWVVVQPLSPFINLAVIVGAVLLVFPLVSVGRILLDRDPRPRSAEWLTTFVHAVLMAAFGAAAVRAGMTYEAWRLWVIPIPPAIGLILAIVTGAAAVLAVLNLALRGLGAPFAIALSSRLAVDWLYAWTRNPMVLATLACILAIGLWIQSAGFILWVLLLVAPALLFFVKVFEERELDIRFGKPYREYKARTPMLIPRRPVAQAAPAPARPRPKRRTKAAAEPPRRK